MANSKKIQETESQRTIIKLFLYSTISGNYTAIAQSLGVDQHDISDALEGRSLRALSRLRTILDEKNMLPSLFLIQLAAKIENLEKQIIKNNDLELQERRNMTEKLDLILKQQANAAGN